MRPHRQGGLGRLATVVAAGCAVVLGAGPAPAVAQDGHWWQVQWRMDEVWQLADGSGVTVAVFDSGVSDIPELSHALLPGADFINPGGDGRTDYDNAAAHGTNMAIAVAADGSVRGMAPGADILPVAIFQPGDTDFGNAGVGQDEFPEAIRWAVDNGAHILNFSYASATPCEHIADAIEYALRRDAVIVAAAGNDRDATRTTPGGCPGVLTVGATDVQMEPWARTHRTEQVDVAAPGVALPQRAPNGQWGRGDGTSVATALVSGVLALLRSEFPEASPEQLVQRLIATARDVHLDGWDDLTGYGLVRPYHALTATAIPPDTPSPPFDALAATQSDAPSPPGSPPPEALLPASDTDDGGSALPMLLGAGVVAAAGVVLLLVVLRRRGSSGSGAGPTGH